MKRSKTKLKFKEGLIVITAVSLLVFMTFFLRRENLTNFINKVLPPREADLMSGMILGEKNNLEKSLKTNLKNSGLMHLVVISGANLMILMKFIIDRLAGLLNRKTAIIIGMLYVWSFVELIGWQVSVLRAVLIVSIIYWAQILGRKFSVVRATILVFVLMVLIDINFVTEVSFWLSFAAYVGVVTSDKKWSWWWVPLWTMPILAIFFGEISLVAPVANILIMGISEIVIVIGLAGVMIGQLVFWLGKGILLMLWPLLKYFLYVTEILGEVKWAAVTMNFNWMMLVGWYLILGGYCLAKRQK